MSKERESGFSEKAVKGVEYGAIAIAFLGVIGGLVELAFAAGTTAVGIELYRRYKAKKKQGG